MRTITATRRNKPRQVAAAQYVDAQAFHPPGEKSAWGTSELTEDIKAFLSYGGKATRLLTRDGKTVAVFESVGLPELLKIMRKYRERFKPTSALRALAANEETIRKIRADYRSVPQNRFIYVHGLARLPEEALAGKGEELLLAVDAALKKRKPGNLFFGYLDCTEKLNERSLRVSLRNGFVIDDHARSVYSPGDLHLRIVRLPVKPQTTEEGQSVRITSGPEFFGKAQELLGKGFIGVRFDANSRAVVFQKLKNASAN